MVQLFSRIESLSIDLNKMSATEFGNWLVSEHPLPDSSVLPRALLFFYVLTLSYGHPPRK